VVRALIEDYGMHPDTVDRTARTALHWAADRGAHEVIEYLQGLPGSSKQPRAKQELTPFHRAVQKGHLLAIMALAQDPTLDVEARTSQGRTALMIAAKRGIRAQVRYLVESLGASVRAVDEQGRTVLHHAAMHGHEEVSGCWSSWLVRGIGSERGMVGPVTCCLLGTLDGSSSCWRRVRVPTRTQVVAYLVGEAGLDAGAVDAEGHTAADLAAAAGFDKLAELLRVDGPRGVEVTGTVRSVLEDATSMEEEEEEGEDEAGAGVEDNIMEGSDDLVRSAHGGPMDISMDLEAALFEFEKIKCQALLCPISGELMTDPVVGSDGITYQREALEDRIARAGGGSDDLVSPVTGGKMVASHFTNEAFRRLVATLDVLDA
jgi:hypothetical protein